MCVGPRSAVFAPIEDLGLIVVDEEHDASYKHEGDPRYDAREVAAERAALQGALLLLGSATPRPRATTRSSALRLPRPRGRPPAAGGGAAGHARAEPRPASADRAGAGGRARERGKAIVLLNRRGWSNFLSCRSCGRVWSCPHCDVALVLHRARGRRRVPPLRPQRARCPRAADAARRAVARHGAGTERLQHDLRRRSRRRAFPIFRLDADTIPGAARGRATARARCCAASSAAPAGVLIGTQMVAKGHDFPDVTLGVVLDADATLRFPDFRAEERTFALIAQLAGRVGRGGEGRVLVQTIAPEARAIAYAARHDSEGFLAGELQRRAALRYPPFSHLIRIVCAAPEAARRAGGGRALCAHSWLGLERCERPGPAALFRLRGRERQDAAGEGGRPAPRRCGGRRGGAARGEREGARGRELQRRRGSRNRTQLQA